MTNFKALAFSGLVLSLAASGWAHAQSTSPVTPPTTTPGAATPTLPAPPSAAPAGEDDDIATDDDMDNATLGDDEPNEASADAERSTMRPEAGGRSVPGRMGRMDADGDGSIGKAEFQQKRAERLKAADADGDGVLSKTELEAMVLLEIAERRAARLEKRLDIDGDGRVTLAEIESMRSKRFAFYDRNDDGRLDARELAALHRGMGPGEMRRGGDRHERPGGYGRHGERHGRHGGEGWHNRGYGWDRMPGGERGFD